MRKITITTARTICAVATIGLLVGCTPEQAATQTAPLFPDPIESSMPPASEAATTSASVALLRCLALQAAKVDDHASDASTIASSIDGSCMDQWNALEHILAQGKTPPEAVALLEATQDISNEDGFALHAVLLERKYYAANK